jgi:hypothetical protein
VNHPGTGGHAGGRPSDGVTGTFRLTVRAAGHQDGNLYLNSERDYRDPRNISIDIPDALAAEMFARFGTPVETRLAGRTLPVTGTARKTRIGFNLGGCPTGKYYHQTHIQVRSAAQIGVPDATTTD